MKASEVEDNFDTKKRAGNFSLSENPYSWLSTLYGTSK